MFGDARHALITGAAGAVGSALADVVAARAPRARLTLVDKDIDGATRVAARIRARGASYARGVQGGPALRPPLTEVDEELATRRLRGSSRAEPSNDEDRVRALSWDLAKPADLESAWKQATREEAVDVLVNCAGIMELRSFAGTSWALGSLLLDVDLISPLRLMSLAVPAMRERGFGLVVNVASMAGLVPLRGSAYYGAAKAGLAMASEIARLELAREGVHVVTVYPGPVASELERRARAQVGKSWTARAIPTGKASELAERIARAAERKQPRVIYPSVYAGAAEVLSVARRFTERFSPAPLE